MPEKQYRLLRFTNFCCCQRDGEVFYIFDFYFNFLLKWAQKNKQYDFLDDDEGASALKAAILADAIAGFDDQIALGLFETDEAGIALLCQWLREGEYKFTFE